MRIFSRSSQVAALSLLAALATGAVVPATAAAAEADPTEKITTTVTLADGTEAETVPNRWFVELSADAVAEGGSQKQVDAEQGELADAIAGEGIDATVTTSYGELWNGVAVEVEDVSDVEELAALDQVVSIQPVILIDGPETEVEAAASEVPAEAADTTPTVAPTAEPTAEATTEAAEEDGTTTASEEEDASTQTASTGSAIANTRAMGGVAGATARGLTGKGIKVGIIDTGIDLDHPDLGGTGTSGGTSFPTAKIAYGYDYVGDAYTGKNTPHPDAVPDDTRGHGTHVAGIVASTSATRMGTAPDVTLGSYRVFGTTGSTSSEVVVRAMEQAAADGMDVVNMSIGADYLIFSDYSTATAAENLARQGIIVVTSQGNAGSTGRWSMGAPGGATHVLAVANALTGTTDDTRTIGANSAWGLNSDLSLKPDLSAPGTSIWSTYPLDKGSAYAQMSGTSMASPYVAGAVALMLQARPEVRAMTSTGAFDAVADALRATADPVRWSGAPASATTYEPLARQGAGMVDVDDALATVTASPSVLNLGESADGATATTVTLSNPTAAAVTYRLSHTDAVTVTGAAASPTRGTSAPATVSTDGTTVTVPARGTAQVTVTVTAPAGVTDGDFYGGWVVLTPTTGTAVIRVPFSGVGGSLAHGTVIGGRQATFLGDGNGTALTGSSYAFTVSSGLYGDAVTVNYTLNVPATRFYLTVAKVGADGAATSLGGQTFASTFASPGSADATGSIVSASALKRTVNKSYTMTWDGTYRTTSGQARVPAGTYRLSLHALPVGGDMSDPSDWSTWTSSDLRVTYGAASAGQAAPATPTTAPSTADPAPAPRAQGWVQEGGSWFLYRDGARLTGWQQVGGSWYYLAASGAMTTGWQQVGGSWYYLAASGAMSTGWQKLGGAWYYLNGSGVMATGWVQVGGAWYYMNGSGVMATGWQKLGGSWYYLYASGVMASSTWVGGYYLQANGVMR